MWKLFDNATHVCRWRMDMMATLFLTPRYFWMASPVQRGWLKPKLCGQMWPMASEFKEMKRLERQSADINSLFEMFRPRPGTHCGCCVSLCWPSLQLWRAGRHPPEISFCYCSQIMKVSQFWLPRLVLALQGPFLGGLYCSNLGRGWRTPAWICSAGLISTGAAFCVCAEIDCLILNETIGKKHYLTSSVFFPVAY